MHGVRSVMLRILVMGFSSIVSCLVFVLPGQTQVMLTLGTNTDTDTDTDTDSDTDTDTDDGWDGGADSGDDEVDALSGASDPACDCSFVGKESAGVSFKKLYSILFPTP